MLLHNLEENDNCKKIVIQSAALLESLKFALFYMPLTYQLYISTYTSAEHSSRIII
jgi:hypothetical protein